MPRIVELGVLSLCTRSRCRVSGSAGAVSGVQSSLQSAFQTLSYAVGIAVPRAEDFAWLMAGSCCVVAAAATLYTSFFLRYRNAAWSAFADGQHTFDKAHMRKHHSATLCGFWASEGVHDR